MARPDAPGMRETLASAEDSDKVSNKALILRE
jgi:hypothetical protein